MRTKDFSGVCTSHVDFSLDEEGLVQDVSFTKGCSGNLKAIASLVEGRHAEEVIPLMEGITCGSRPTSCPDQFAQALREELDQREAVG